jgi:hypothetical protein
MPYRITGEKLDDSWSLVSIITILLPSLLQYLLVKFKDPLTVYLTLKWIGLQWAHFRKVFKIFRAVINRNNMDVWLIFFCQTIIDIHFKKSIILTF